MCEHEWQFGGVHMVSIRKKVWESPERDYTFSDEVGVWPFRHVELRSHHSAAQTQWANVLEPHVFRGCMKCGTAEMLPPPDEETSV